MADPTGVVFGHDVSHHQDSIDVGRLDGEYVIARTAQAKGGKYGTTIDQMYPTHKRNALRAGKLFSAYFYLGNGISAAANAALHASVEPDRAVPVMLDWEQGSGDVAFLRACVAAFQDLGYRVWCTYAPKWYLDSVGGSLAGLPPLVSSRYPDNAPDDVISEYRDVSDAMWAGYGGNTVLLLQFTSTGRDAAYPNVNLDSLAFRGTRAQLAAIMGGQATGGGAAVPAVTTTRKDEPVQIPAGANAHFSDVVPEGVTELYFATGYNDQLTVHQFDFWGVTDNAKDPKGTGNGVGGGFGTVKIDPNRPGPVLVKVPANAVMYNLRYTANHAFGLGWR